MPENLEEHTIFVNTAELHYYQLGSSGKSVLVLLHGFSDNGLCWQAEAEELAADHEIYMPEMRGHGMSTRVKPGERFDMVEDLFAFIQDLGLRKPVIAGHSMGASIAFNLGARYPDLPAGLVLEDPPWFGAFSEGEAVPENVREINAGRNPFAQFIDSLQGKTVDELVAQFRLEHSSWPEQTLRRWCEAKLQLDPNINPALSMPHEYWKNVLESITCPVLLFTASPDLGGIVTPEMAVQAQEMKPDLKIAPFPDVGHHIRFAEHEAYMKELVAFLDGLGVSPEVI